MAGADKQEFTPLLRPGFHPFTVAALRALCVHRFPDSFTRARLMDRLEKVIDLIQQGRMRGNIWIDGSFLTEKLNPDDVDLLLAVTVAEYRAMDLGQRTFFDWFRTNSLYLQYKCDNYAVLLDNQIAEAEYMYAYWLKQFGFSRGDQMKGVAVIAVPFLVAP